MDRPDAGDAICFGIGLTFGMLIMLIMLIICSLDMPEKWKRELIKNGVGYYEAETGKFRIKKCEGE